MMVRNPVMDRLSKQSKGGNPGRAAEKKLAKVIGGKPTIASGAIDFDKGDIKYGNFLIESKSTRSASVRVDLNWLLGIAQQAIEVGKVPALALSFTDSYGSPITRGSWVAVPVGVFMELFPQE